MRGGLRGLFTENAGPSGKSSRRAWKGGGCVAGASSGRMGEQRGAPAIRESATTSGGSVDPAAKVRRYRRRRRRRRRRLLCDAERADVCIRGGTIRGSLFSPVRSVLRCRSETEERPAECASDEASSTLIQLRNGPRSFATSNL